MRAMVSASRSVAEQPRRHGSQEPVAGLVPERVVDLFEPVEVDEQRGAVDAAPAGPGEHLLDPVQDEGAVGEPGERIVECLVPDALEQPGVADRDRRLAGEAPHPVRYVRVVGQALGPVDDVADHETDRFAVDADRDRRDCRAPQLVHEARQRLPARGGVAVPDVHGDVGGADLGHRNVHRAQPHVGLRIEALRGHDAADGGVRFEQDDRGPVASDHRGDRAGDVRGHLVGRGDLGQ